MMITCEAHGCSSSQNTEVDGKEILFFSFPEDDTQRERWLKNCELTDVLLGKDKTLYLCELHFEKMSLSASKELKPNAVPTIFDKVEEGQRKRKAESVIQTGPSKSPPPKQKKLDEDSHSLVTPPQSPLTQLMDNVDEIIGENKTDISPKQDVSINGSALLQSQICQQLEMGKKIYRLTIEIDKICGKPCPRSKKLIIFAESIKQKEQELLSNIHIDHPKEQQKICRKTVCAKGGCKLRKSVYKSKPAFQCERCDKYYITKRTENQEERNNSCSICHKSFSSSQSLCFHVKTHFVCDMCQTECTSQVTYDKHARLHVSTDPLYPYKCHQCTEIFELKEDVRQHYLIVHPTIKLQNTILQVTASPIAPQLPQQKDYRCVSCNITFRNEQAYRNHVNSHKKKEGLRCSIGDTNNIFPVPNPLTGSQIGILRAVKFSCRVCSMEFDNVGEVDKHTRTHLEDVEEEHKCNICRKLFKTSAQLNEHLKNHLSRAHPCPVCPKAFINRTTLKIHLKTHGEA